MSTKCTVFYLLLIRLLIPSTLVGQERPSHDTVPTNLAESSTFKTGYFLMESLYNLSKSSWNGKGNFIIAEFLFSFGSAGEGRGKLKNPLAIAADPQGNLYIADSGNNRIQKFDGHGRFIAEVGGFGWGKEQFDRPTDLCAKSGLDVFVADYNNSRIERYDRKFNYISSLASTGNEEEHLRFAFPRSVDISPHGDLFIAENENNRILKVNSFGEPEISFGDVESGEGKLESPASVQVSQSDFVYVCDEVKGQIVVYDYFGNYVKSFGEGQLQDSKGIFLQEKSQMLFVADYGNNRIVAFGSLGKEIPLVALAGGQPLSFEKPIDLVIVHQLMYVLENGRNRVCVFRLKVQVQ